MEDFSTSTANVVPIIGLTGGIGSGKTTVGQIFESLGIPRWDADAAGHAVYRMHADLRNQVLERFGQDLAIMESGNCVDIHRALLGERVFQDSEGLAALNQWVHPLVRNAFKTWMQSHSPSPYVIREAAILFESGAHTDCRQVITVSAPSSLRLERAMKRSSLTREKAALRMEHQWTDEQREDSAQHRIDNGLHAMLIPQVMAIHGQLLQQFQ
jgi:dephospho-CoA kinase